MSAHDWARSGPLILVVDDETDIREMIAELLRMDGHRVITARDGRAALEQAHASRPDLIVLDLMMPVMTGWQFIEAQQSDPALAAIPVVVITAGLDREVAGAAMLLRKPFDIDLLLAAVSVLCGRGLEHPRPAMAR